MNIFIVDKDPVRAAFDLPDKLVVKMPVETVQLLTPWAHKTHDFFTLKPDGTTYGIKGFQHHPCAKWLYESESNVHWLLIHGLALAGAYSMRYRKTHGSYFALRQLTDLVTSRHPDANWRGHTEFVQAMPSQHKIPNNAVTAYRNYLMLGKGYAEWNHSNPPTWWDEKLHEPVRNQYLSDREIKKQERRNAKHLRVPSSI